ncbi:MAG: hypothetical protein Q9175_002268 [Cornicularia normoerica]
MAVNPMSQQEAQDLLETSQLESPNDSHLNDSRSLLEALEYLPLAITQAAAFISENQITPKKYLEMFRESDSVIQDLLDEDVGDPRRDSQSHNSVIKTWKISFDLISKQKPRAAKMLSLMAVLDRQGIPESLLQDDSDQVVEVTKALGILLAFSLIKAGGDGTGYELHRLVQLATRKWLQMQDTIGEWQGKALSVVADVFPNGRFEVWTTCESLLPHAQTVIQYGDTNRLCPEKYSKLLSKVARFDRLQGRYEIACVRCSAAIEVQRKIFGSDHSFTLHSMNNLAIIYERQGRWEEAEKLHVQVLEASKRVLRAEHPFTLTTMNNLAIIYGQQQRWEEAEKLHVQVIEARKRVLTAEHPDTLTTMNNLAIVYERQGRWEEAGKLHLQVLEASKRVLRAEHPDTLTTMNNLAVIYERQGRWEEAEKLHLQVLEASKRVLRAEHPDTLTTMNNLAIIYRHQGRWEEAEKLQVQGLEASKRVLGAEHPETLNSITNLAIIYGEQQRWDEAEKLYVQVLEASKRVLGAEHPDRLTSMNNLALIYNGQDRHSEAIVLMESVVELRTKKLGADHPDTIDAAESLEMWLDSPV